MREGAEPKERRANLAIAKRSWTGFSGSHASMVAGWSESLDERLLNGDFETAERTARDCAKKDLSAERRSSDRAGRERAWGNRAGTQPSPGGE